MQYRMTALTNHDHAGLYSVCRPNDLFRRVPNRNYRFEFDLLFLGALAHWPKATLEAIALVIEHRVEFGAFCSLRRADDRQHVQRSSRISGHEKCNVQSVLRMR